VEFQTAAGGSVGLSDDEGNFVAGGDDGFEGGNGEFGGATENEIQHFVQSSTASRGLCVVELTGISSLRF
jgi:hypothetical protein